MGDIRYDFSGTLEFTKRVNRDRLHHSIVSFMPWQSHFTKVDAAIMTLFVLWMCVMSLLQTSPYQSFILVNAIPISHHHRDVEPTTGVLQPTTPITTLLSSETEDDLTLQRSITQSEVGSDHALVDLDTKSYSTVPPQLTEIEFNLVKNWTGNGESWPVLSTTDFIAPTITIAPPHYECVRQAMKHSGSSGECDARCQSVWDQYHPTCLIEVTFIKLCINYWCTRVVSNLNKRINYVVKNVSIGNEINRLHEPDKHILQPSPKVAWDYLIYVLRSMDVNGKLSQLPMHFHAFARVVEGERDSRIHRRGTLMGNGAYLIQPLLIHLTDDRWSGVSDETNTRAVTHKLNQVDTNTHVFTDTPIPFQSNIYPNWTRVITEDQRKKIWSSQLNDYTHANAGPHLHTLLGVKRAPNGVLFVCWNNFYRADFLHAYGPPPPSNHDPDWSTTWPESWTPIEFLENMDAIRSLIMTDYELLEFQPIGGTHFKKADRSFTYSNTRNPGLEPHTYLYRGIRNGITFETLFVEDRKRLPALKNGGPEIHFPHPSTTDVLSIRFGLTRIVSIYPTLGDNFPKGLECHIKESSISHIQDLDLTGIASDQPQFNQVRNKALGSIGSKNDFIDRIRFG